MKKEMSKLEVVTLICLLDDLKWTEKKIIETLHRQIAKAFKIKLRPKPNTKHDSPELAAKLMEKWFVNHFHGTVGNYVIRANQLGLRNLLMQSVASECRMLPDKFRLTVKDVHELSAAQYADELDKGFRFETLLRKIKG